MSGLKIVEISNYLPLYEIDNDALSKFIDTNDEWIKSRSGISKRRFAIGETVADMSSKAVYKLLDKSGVSKEDIGILCVATFTSEYNMPSVACQVHEKLGLAEDMLCFDINAACTGFIYNLEVTRSLLLTKKDKYAIIVCAEKISNYLDFEDRSTCVLFGDGAAALLVRLDDSKKLVTSLKSRGMTNILYSRVKAFNGLEPASRFIDDKNISKEAERLGISMNGREVFRFAVDVVEKSINEVLEKTNNKKEDIKYFVCHQANSRIISHVSKKMKIELERFYMNLENYGNTSAASIPLALSEMYEKGLLKSGDLIICTGFGAGLTWGSALIEI